MRLRIADHIRFERDPRSQKVALSYWSVCPPRYLELEQTLDPGCCLEFVNYAHPEYRFITAL
jgi:hypothetical protein